MNLTTQLNITRLTEQLWTGGDLPEPLPVAAAHLGAWSEHGIDHIVDCRGEWSDEELVRAVAPNIRYSHLGVDDAGQRMPAEWFETVAALALSTIRSGGNVLVHCHMGINRGPSGAYALLLAMGWDPVVAIELVRTLRPIAAVGYAEDALAWWHDASGADQERRSDDVARLHDWRLRHPHDTVRIIREIRALELG